MSDKISIILPIFNVESHLKSGIDSLLNQSIGMDNLEIIMVDDASTDGSGEIIDEYSEKYDCCIAIHLDKNTGSANGPRNRGIEESTGDYIMFLDPDDRYTADCCKTLYNHIKENNVDVVFGRFRRIFPNHIVQKSYSPYLDDLKKKYPGETFREDNPLNVSDKTWNRIFKKIVYGKNNKGIYPRDKPLDIIKVDNIKQEPDLLKMPPSIWTKIYKRKLITKNDIRFPPYICGEDLAFNIETLLKANGIMFLNNFICYDYYIRDFNNDKSISNNINIELLKDTMNAYIYCHEITKNYSKTIQNISINPHLMYWINTCKNANFTMKETQELLKKVNKLQKIHNNTLKTKLLLSTIKIILQTSIYSQKIKKNY